MASKHLKTYSALKLLKKTTKFLKSRNISLFILWFGIKVQTFLVLASMGENSTVGGRKFTTFREGMQHFVE